MSTMKFTSNSLPYCVSRALATALLVVVWSSLYHFRVSGGLPISSVRPDLAASSRDVASQEELQSGRGLGGGEGGVRDGGERVEEKRRLKRDGGLAQDNETAASVIYHANEGELKSE